MFLILLEMLLVMAILAAFPLFVIADVCAAQHREQRQRAARRRARGYSPSRNGAPRSAQHQR